MPPGANRGAAGIGAKARAVPGPWGVARALASHFLTSAIWPGGDVVVAPGQVACAGVAAVVAVQVGVEDALQWLRAQQPCTRARVCSLGAVTGVLRRPPRANADHCWPRASRAPAR